MNNTNRFAMLEATAKMIEEEAGVGVWRTVYPRRYVPPAGYANPRWNSALLEVYMHFMDNPKPNKVEIDCILCGWQIIKNLVPTFFVGQEFAESLVQTEPPENLTIRELQWPFEGMCFVLPEKFQMDYLGVHVPFVRMAIHKTGPQPAPERVKKFYPWAPTFGISEEKYGENAFIITFTAMYDDKPVDYSGSFSDLDTIDRMMTDQKYQDFCVDPVSAKEMEIVAQTNTVEDMILIKKVIALCAHLLLAMNAVPEQIEADHMLRPPKLKNGVVVKQELWAPRWIGRTYTWNRDRVNHGGHHASPRLHPRRGHWRRQQIGPRVEDKKQRQSKVIWIKPMLVGAKPETKGQANDKTAKTESGH
jgi:hypothetical protein